MRTSTRARQVALLARPIAHGLPWHAVAASAGAAFLIQLPAWNLHVRVVVTRASAVMLAIGAAFMLDDPAEATVAAAPLPRALRRALRVAVGMPAVALAWAGLLAWASASVAVPAAALTLELAGFCAVALAASAVATPYVPDGLGGVAGGPTLAALVVGAVKLPERWALLPPHPLVRGWSAAHTRWWPVLGCGVAIAAAASLDPARRVMNRRCLAPRQTR